MSVDTQYIVMIGLREEFDSFKEYNSKNDKEYIDDVNSGYIKNYKNIIFHDYLPPNFKLYQDGMCGEYDYFGKVLDVSDYIEEIKSFSFSSEELQKYKEEVIKEFEALKLNFKKEDVKLNIFVDFS